MDLLSTIAPEFVFWSCFVLFIYSEVKSFRSENNIGKKIRSKNGIGKRLRSKIGNSTDRCDIIGKKNSSMERIYIKSDINQSDSGSSNGGNIMASTDSYDEHCRLVTYGGRGDKSRNTLREIRKHQRIMKAKYYRNRDNLLFYCYYKGITAKYYQTLQHPC